MLPRFLHTLLWIFFALGVPAATVFATAESALQKKLDAWEAELDAIYTPDPFDPEIPFRITDTTTNAANADLLARRDAFVSKRPIVSRFKKKARPEEVDKYFLRLMPTETDPVVLSNRAKVREEIQKNLKTYERVSARDVFTHPVSKFFPGDVSEKFRRVATVFYADTRAKGWQSTGFYAAPGERVKVHVSRTGTELGLKVRIGCHTDNLLDSKQRYWYRFPSIARTFSVSEQSFEIANPFGGLIYVYSPKGNTSARIPSRTQFKFSGVVEAPFFVLGQTKPAEWAHIRYAPAPWAEFVGKNFIATIPADDAATIDDPAAVIRFWDEVVASLDRLTAQPEREQPIRFVVDIEPSSAVGHSDSDANAPIVGNLLWSRTYWDLEQIRNEGSWGLFRAIGEKMLSKKWVFNDDRNTPAALLAAFCMEKSTGRKAATFFDLPALHAAALARVRREELAEKNKKALREELRLEQLKERRRERPVPVKKSTSAEGEETATAQGRREREELAKEADVEDARQDPGIVFQNLSAYLAIVDETGWEPLAKLFKLYTVRNRLPLSSNEEKQRTFTMLWSQTTKKNLSPFLEFFKFEHQGSAVKYPKFMPENFPPENPDLRPQQGGTGFLGKSPFPTIAVYNSSYRVKQLPKPQEEKSEEVVENGEEEDDDALDDEEISTAPGATVPAADKSAPDATVPAADKSAPDATVPAAEEAEEYEDDGDEEGSEDDSVPAEEESAESDGNADGEEKPYSSSTKRLTAFGSIDFGGGEADEEDEPAPPAETLPETDSAAAANADGENTPPPAAPVFP